VQKRRISRGIEDLSVVSIPGSWGHIWPVRRREGSRAGEHVISVLGPASNRFAMWGLGCFAIRDGGLRKAAERPRVRIDDDGCIRRVWERSFVENKRDIRLGGQKGLLRLPKSRQKGLLRLPKNGYRIQAKMWQILPKAAKIVPEAGKRVPKSGRKTGVFGGRFNLIGSDPVGRVKA